LNELPGLEGPLAKVRRRFTGGKVHTLYPYRKGGKVKRLLNCFIILFNYLTSSSDKRGNGRKKSRPGQFGRACGE
jgi:hypothetical protein